MTVHSANWRAIAGGTKGRRRTIRVFSALCLGLAEWLWRCSLRQRLALLGSATLAKLGLATGIFVDSGLARGDLRGLRGRLWASTDDHLGIGDVIESGDDQKDRDDSGEKERTRHF